MLRFSLIVCLSLIFGITAKPYKPGNKLTDEAYQDIVVSMDDKGKMSWGVEVEPPEDLDESDSVIDPRMKIWKNMMSSGQNKPLKAGEDSDKLFHPSMTDLIKFQMQNQGVSAVLSAANDQAEPSQKDDSLKLTEDSDKLLHSSVSDLLKMRMQNQGVSAFLSAADVHAEPSQKDDSLKLTEDSDKLLHSSVSDLLKMRMQNQGVSAFLSAADVHAEPSQKDDSLKLTEDSDKLLHFSVSDLLKMRMQNQGVSAFLSAAEPSQKDANMKSYQEPEEDRDDIDHPAFSDSLKLTEDSDKLLHSSVSDLLKMRMQNQGVSAFLSAADAQAEPLQKDANMKSYQEPEEDRDDIDHPAFSDSLKEPEQDWEKVVDGYLAPLTAQYKGGAKVHVVHSEPEMDEDELYHRNYQPVQMEPLGREEVGESAAARVEEPFQRKYNEPEEDLDDLYH